MTAPTIVPTALRGSRGAIDRIDEACAAELPTAELLRQVIEQIGRVVPIGAFFASATDPETMLTLGGGLVAEMPPTTCDPFWSFEFEVPDFNKFADLVRGDRCAADLHAVTGGRPERSARWRELQTHGAFDAELRAAFKAGGRAWGVMQLNRTAEHGAFTPAEVEFVEAIAPRVGRALRRSTITHACDDHGASGPGMAVLDHDLEVVSATTEAVEWFGRVSSYQRRHSAPLGIGIPYEVLQVAHAARSRAANGHGSGATRTRLRTVCGSWLLIHASCMAGAAGHTAIVIEPASASEVAPLIVEAYELTPRELDVTRGLARGLTTSEIAGELFLSRYTVQDHLKRIYDKVGVASRGELVAKMFADHYRERMAVEHASAPMAAAA